MRVVDAVDLVFLSLQDVHFCHRVITGAVCGDLLLSFSRKISPCFISVVCATGLFVSLMTAWFLPNCRSFNTESGFDLTWLFDGPNVSSPVVKDMNGFSGNNPSQKGPYSSSSGTFHIVTGTDVNTLGTGFTFAWWSSACAAGTAGACSAMHGCQLPLHVHFLLPNSKRRT